MRVKSREVKSHFSKFYKRSSVVLFSAFLDVVSHASSTTTNATTFGGMAQNLNSQFTDIGNLMLNTAYIAGLGFGIAAIFKFKQHKDNPTQVPIGTPFALLAVSILLVFLPGLYSPAAQSIYGKTSGVSAGTGGTGVSLMPGGSTT